MFRTCTGVVKKNIYRVSYKFVEGILLSLQHCQLPRAPCTRASRSPAGSRTPGFPGRRLQRRRGTANGARAHGAILYYCYGACYRIGKDLRSVLRVDNRALTSLHRRRQQPTGYIDEPPPPPAVSSSDRSRGRPATATDRSIGRLVCPGAAARWWPIRSIGRCSCGFGAPRSSRARHDDHTTH